MILDKLSWNADEHFIHRIDDLFEEWDSDESPGCALGIIKDGRLICAPAYGMANLEYQDPLCSSSIFHVASISKQFTAMCILLLEKEGKLSLDDDIRDYLPEVPDFGQRITIRHLIHHTSGLRDQWELLSFAGWRDDDLKTEDDILQLVSHQKELNFLPGEQYAYCNTGYTLMAVIIKRVTGQTLRSFADERLFKPLFMDSTHFHDDHTECINFRTSAYLSKDDGTFAISIPVFDNAGATSLFTNLYDLACWDRNFYDKKVAGSAVITRMHEPGVLNSGKKLDYAHGLMLGRYRGLKTVAHSGSDAGYRSYYVRFPEHNASIVCLCNLNTINPIRLAMQVADIILADEFPYGEPVSLFKRHLITLSDEKLLEKTGVYLNSSTCDLRRIDLKDGKLMVANPKDRLQPLSENRFRAASSHIEYTIDSAGLIEKNLANDDSTPLVFEKVSPVELDSKRIEEYLGDYFSDELDVKYEVITKDGEIFLRRKKMGNAPLTPLLDDSFYFNESKIMEFTRDSNGQITGFMLSTFRTRHIRFVKIGFGK